MNPITMINRLPFVAVTLRANGQILQLQRVLLDTGSAGSLFKTDDLRGIGVTGELTDRIRFMSGIGGREAVIEKQIETLEVGNLIAHPFKIQMGSLSYDFAMDGILGADFLLATNAIIDFRNLQLGGG
jgi:hypothetical protein